MALIYEKSLKTLLPIEIFKKVLFLLEFSQKIIQSVNFLSKCPITTIKFLIPFD